MRAIRVSAVGGPEKLEYVEVDTPSPGPGEVRVRHHAIGVNFLDTYHRSGLYQLPLPFTPGSEAAGVVEEVGPEVHQVREGDRVVYSALGAYADAAVVNATRLVPLPDGIDYSTAAAAFLQGITAQFLVTSTYALKERETVLVHAAAGGVGALLVQMAKQRGARVIGTASSTKLDVARAAGADVVVDYTAERFDERALTETGGEGVDVVYDSVGRSTFDGSINCLRVRGMLVCFGQSSGPIPAVDILRLGRKSLYLTRPSFAQYTAREDELRWRAGEVFAAIRRGDLTVRVDAELPLSSAAEAHRRLEGRQTIGKLLLIP